MKTLIFYYGTDARMVMMSEAERFEYKQVCSMAIAYLWTLYQPFHEKDMMLRDLMPALKYDEAPTMYLNLMSAMNCLGGMMSGNGLYQYDAFYLTTLHGRAESYARRAFAGGEYALTAYRMYQAAMMIDFDNWQPSSKVADALKWIVDVAEGKPQPVIFRYDNLNPQYLQIENGRTYTEELYDVIQNVRYTGKIKLNIEEAEWLEPT